MNNQVVTKDINIEDLIYEIRGKQVMLDSDLAKLYKCANGTKTINQAVMRNVNRFPSDFYFQLTYKENLNLKSQFGTSSLNNHGGIRKLPHVFTEEGVAMLATVLKTEVASIVSINIMRAFVSMKKYISSNLIEQKYVNDLVFKHNKEIELLKESFQKLEEKRKVNGIYFKGQIYDAYSKIVDIFKQSQKELIIIDAYADKTILDMIKDLHVVVILIASKNNSLKELDIKKYNEQYHNLQIIINNNYHDRYFIIDKREVYHCGTSINYAGTKTFSINILSDEIVKKSIISNIQQIIGK